MTKTFLVKGVRYLNSRSRQTDMRETIYHASIRAYNRVLKANGKDGQVTDKETIDRFLVPVLARPQLHAINGRPC